jgi:cytidylate kinase
VKATVVCISSTDGAASDRVGEVVAERLGFRLANGSIIVAAAQAHGLLPESVLAAESRDAGRTLEVDFGRVERTETVRNLIKEAVLETADEGSVVILAHAASYALAGRDGVLRVLVTAPTGTRIGRIAEQDRLDEKQAGKLVAESDKSRAAYLERFYHVKHELPTDYDLVLNTDRLSSDEAAAIIVDAATRAQ